MQRKKRTAESDRFEAFGICELRHIDQVINRKRFYCIDLQPGLFELILSRRWGRIGCKPRELRQYFESSVEAVKAANLVYRQKIQKGYQEG